MTSWEQETAVAPPVPSAGKHAGDTSERRPRLLVGEGDELWQRWALERLSPAFAVDVVASGRALSAALARRKYAAVIVGSQLSDVAGGRLAASLVEHGTGPVLWMARSAAPSPPGVHGTLSPSMSPLALRNAVRASIAPSAPPAPAPAPPAPAPPDASAVPAALWPRLGEAVRRVALQRSARDVSRVIGAVVPELLDADRATCLFFDAASGALWHEADVPMHDHGGHADHGLAGHAARHGVTLVCARAADDPRFVAALDDPHGRGDERLLVQPIGAPGGAVHAVLVVARAARGHEFGARETALLAGFAGRCAPLLDALAWDAEAAAEAAASAPAGVFRPQALAAYAERRRSGDVVRVHSTWVRASYWLLIVVALVALAYLWLARVPEFASGAGVVVADDRREVTADVAGVVDAVLAGPGQAVAAGQIVARLRDDQARAELAGLDAQFEQQVLERLLAPEDPAVEQRLGTLVAERERARQHLERHVLRAAVAGVAGEPLVQPGASVVAGESIVAVVAGDGRMSLVAALPAGVRPMLELGMRARVQLADHRGHAQELTVVEISSDAFGPAAARRKLGALLGDAVPVHGAVILVRLELPAAGFVTAGRAYRYHHGMLARVDVRVRSERLATALVPGLKEIVGP